MAKNKFKVIAQLAAGIFGGTVLGITGFLTMVNYGGNYGCWAAIDALFGTAGYESCGSFGALVGEFLGVIIGIIVLSLLKMKRYGQAAIYLLASAFIVPFIYGISMFWSGLEWGIILMIVSVILGAMISSAIASGVIVGIIYLAKYIKSLFKS